MRRLTAIWLAVCTAVVLSAQVLTPVHWSARTTADSVFLTARIDSGWHMTLIALGDSAIGMEYDNECHLSFPLSSEGISVRFNACDDWQCTAPEVYSFAPSAPSSDTSPSIPSAAPSSGAWMLFLMGLLGGLLAIFTPCIWPVIPMTVSFFMKRQQAHASPRHALFAALGFAGAIVVIYVGVGLLITLLFGASALNALSTNAFVNLFFFVLFVLFALSFFGLFEITLPSSWSTRLDGSARQRGGVLGILFMACTLVIVSFSCTGPIVGTLLVEAAGRSLWAPAIGMLGFSLALALPFALFALFPNWLQRLPKSGSWMQSFKVTLAFIELALSLKFLSVADLAYGWGILPRWLFLSLWALCFLLLGIYLIRKSWVGKVLALLSWLFTLYLLSGLFGASVRAVAAFAPPAPVENKAVFTRLDEGIAFARQSRKPVLLQFSGYGCVNCRKMEEFVLSDSEVQKALQDYVQIRLYVDSRRDENNNGVPDGVEYAALQRDYFRTNAQPFWVCVSLPVSPVGFALTPSDPASMLDFQQLGSPITFTTSPSLFLQWLSQSPSK